MRKISFSRALVAVVGLIWAISLGSAGNSVAAEKLKFSSSVKVWHVAFLPYYAGEEKGFWKENGLEGEYVPFRGGADQMAATAAGHIVFGATMGPTVFQAAAAGVPVGIVAELYPKREFYVWARSAGRFRDLKDIRGAIIGVHRFGTTSHAYARVLAKALGVEKDVKIIATGGIPETVAALKTGSIDIFPNPAAEVVKLVAAGEAISLGRIHAYMPEEWLDDVLYARKDWVKAHPDTAKRAVRAILQGIKYLEKDPGWALRKMKEIMGITDREARLVMEWEGPGFTKDGKVKRKAIENVREFLIKYDIVSPEKLPPLEQLYTTELTD